MWFYCICTVIEVLDPPGVRVCRFQSGDDSYFRWESLAFSSHRCITALSWATGSGSSPHSFCPPLPLVNSLWDDLRYSMAAAVDNGIASWSLMPKTICAGIGGGVVFKMRDLNQCVWVGSQSLHFSPALSAAATDPHATLGVARNWGYNQGLRLPSLVSQ